MNENNQRATTVISVNVTYIMGMTRNRAIGFIGMAMWNLKKVYALEGSTLGREWMAVDRSQEWDIKFVDMEPGEYGEGKYALYSDG